MESGQDLDGEDAYDVFEAELQQTTEAGRPRRSRTAPGRARRGALAG